MAQKRQVAAPPNLAARALRDDLFRARVVKSKRAYTRKIKHKKGSSQMDAPLFDARRAGVPPGRLSHS